MVSINHPPPPFKADRPPIWSIKGEENPTTGTKRENQTNHRKSGGTYMPFCEGPAENAQTIRQLAFYSRNEVRRMHFG